jgi:hypothetical protein
MNFTVKYGFESLIFEVLEYCDVSMLEVIEQKYLDALKPEFNICKKAYRPPTRRNLTEENIVTIAKLYNAGKSLCCISETLFGTRELRSTFAAIKNGKLYPEHSHLFIKRKYNQNGRILAQKSRDKISKGNMFKGKIKECHLLEIINRLNNKEYCKTIANLYCVHVSNIYNIKNGKTHKYYTHLIL